MDGFSPRSKSPRQSYRIPPEIFVTVWQKSATAQEATEILSEIAGKKVPKAMVLSRASLYRKAGVNLKRMERVDARKLDVEGLNGHINGSKASGQQCAPK